jgi:hypothetical protein
MRFSSLAPSAPVLVAASLLCGCRGETLPAFVPSDSTMVGLILDLHVAEARSELEGSEIGPVRDSLFEAWGVDSVTYDRVLRSYSDDPDAYVHIYDRVLDSLNERTRRADRVSLQDSTFPIP